MVMTMTEWLGTKRNGLDQTGTVWNGCEQLTKQYNDVNSSKPNGAIWTSMEGPGVKISSLELNVLQKCGAAWNKMEHYGTK